MQRENMNLKYSKSAVRHIQVKLDLDERQVARLVEVCDLGVLFTFPIFS